MGLLHKCVIILVVTVSIGIGNVAGCDPSSIMACNNYLTSLSASQLTDPDLVCKRVHKAMDCLETQINKCPTGYQHMFTQVRDQIDYVRSICDGHSSGGSGGTQTTQCDYNIENCILPLNSVTLSTQTDHYICSQVNSALSCLSRASSSCTLSSQQTMLQRHQNDLLRLKDLCSASSSDFGIDLSGTPCSVSELSKCEKDVVDLTVSQRKDRNLLCKAILSSSNCYLAKMSTCPESVQSRLQDVKEKL